METKSGHKQPRVLLIGEEAAGARALWALAQSNCEIAAVMTSIADGSQGTTPLAAAAKELGCIIWPARLVKDPGFAHKVRSADVDIILNVHSLYVIPAPVLQTARIGAFNLHPGPLPQYAGLNTVSWAIYRGETSYGVTVHWMEPQIDAGEIAYQSTFSIEETDTPVRLTHKCVRAGVALIVELLDTAAVNPDAIPKLQQDLTKRRYFGKQIPQEGRLSWSRPAREVVNFVRACDYWPYRSPWGYPKTPFGGREIAIAKAARTYRQSDSTPGTVGFPDESGVLVATKDEWISVRRVIVDGRSLNPRAVLTPGTLL
jgi:UDP-4-amino-4-deoxy-L-arabinose formyltransferase/UDP-glucuronic acid dehydrogenase (UDP-4-keto-hexauronic acid decarboxylating)